jgi:organic radical activating enzyme
MPNLLLTNKCNQSCEYCFSENNLNEYEFSIEEIKKILPFIRDFKINTINIIGGEPSLNPQFFNILELLLREGLKVRVFTNGKISYDLIDRIKYIQQDEIFFVVNRTNPELSSEIVYLYNTNGYRVFLSFTVYKSNQNVEHIIQEIKTYKLSKEYRVGISLPVWPERKNLYLVPGAYSEVAKELFGFISEASHYDIIPRFDCGFPYCFFNDVQKSFFKEHNIDFMSSCELLFDIFPDYTIVPCCPLRKISYSYNPEKDPSSVRGFLEHQLDQQKYNFLFPECKDCEALLEKKCSGGCKALRIL